MSALVSQIAGLMTGSELERRQRVEAPLQWGLEEVAGRLVEIRSSGPCASLSAGFRLVLDAQRLHEPVVWIGATPSCFYPLDAARNGVDLARLPIVCMHDPSSAAAAADQLTRSGAFGLVLLDLGDEPWFPEALQKRLVHHAEEHHTAVVCLTEERRGARTLGSQISLRLEVNRAPSSMQLRATRDRRRGPGWSLDLPLTLP